MTVQYSVATRNARLSAIKTRMSTTGSGVFLYSGPAPVNCAAAATGTKLVDINPGFASSIFFADPSGGVMAFGLASAGALGLATGTIGYFRLYDSVGAIFMQGTVGLSGSGADMIVSSVGIFAGQTININSFTLTDSNA